MNRKDWDEAHVACPKCGNTDLYETLYGVVEVIGEDYEDNVNIAKCSCGWKGKVSELKEK